VQELQDQERDELAAALHKLQAELTALLDDVSAGARPVDLDEPIGRLSRMDAMQQQKMAQASRRAARLRLDQVTAALAALESGDYGLCRDCEEAIGYRRLKARPETPLCLECQRAKER
jgi:DnaK suppressor protein